MKIPEYNLIITGDLHLHDKPYHNSLERSETLLNDLFLLSMKNHKCPLFLNGDIFHVPRPSFAVAMILVNFLRRCGDEGIEVVINVGNHDAFSMSGPTTSYLNLFDPFPHVTVVNKKPHLFKGWGMGLQVLVMPWYPSAEFKRILKHTVDRADFESPTILLAHQPITEGVLNPSGIKKNQDLSYKDFSPEKFLYVFLNDYHEYQQVYKNVWYIGAPIRTKHGEEEQHGPVGIIDGDNTWEHIVLPSDYSDFKTYIVDSKESYIPDYDKFNYNRIYAPADMKPDLQLLYPEATIIPSDMNLRQNVQTRTQAENFKDAIKDFLKLEMRRYEKKKDRQILRKLTKYYYNKAKEAVNV